MSRQSLERNRSAESLVSGSIDFSHASSAQRSLYAISAELQPDGKSFDRRVRYLRHGAVEQTFTVLLQQRFHFCSQVGIRGGQERGPLLWRAPEGLIV